MQVIKLTPFCRFLLIFLSQLPSNKLTFNLCNFFIVQLKSCLQLAMSKRINFPLLFLWNKLCNKLFTFCLGSFIKRSRNREINNVLWQECFKVIATKPCYPKIFFPICRAIKWEAFREQTKRQLHSHGLSCQRWKHRIEGIKPTSEFYFVFFWQVNYCFADQIMRSGRPY